MSIEELKSKIVEANIAYRNGNSVMDDSSFDDLVDELESLLPRDEFSSFRDSLNEGKLEHGAKLKHKYVMGSLDKIKSSDPSSLEKFIKSQVSGVLNVSAKVDGISSVAQYIDGKLVSFASRGDGYEGISFFDKAPFIKGLPKSIGFKDEIFIRGELVIKDDEQVDSSTNLRNVCAGWMNSKTWDKDDISKISFVPYTILGPKYCKDDQFDMLEMLGFKTAWHIDIDPAQPDLCSILADYARMNHGYACDGLVLISSSAFNEQDVYRPKNCMAFKTNELVATTRIIDVTWEGPSKNGTFWPVFVLDPVDLGGATISRASASNIDMIEKLDARYGSVVEITKANDIIPHVDRVIDNSNTTKIDVPTECPCCGTTLIKDGVNIRCPNKSCPDQVVQKVASFIKKVDVKFASVATLKNFGITSFEKLVNFVPDKKKKSEVKLHDELVSHMFTKSKEELLCAMNFDGLAEVLASKILSHYGLDLVESPDFASKAKAMPLPDGVGEVMLDKFIEGLPDALHDANVVMSDVRWNPSSVIQASASEVKGSICVTGSLKFGSREKFLDFAKEHGYISKAGVSKGLTYLITNDINSGSSKARKAKELGTKVITEDEFIKMVSSDEIEEDVSSL